MAEPVINIAAYKFLPLADLRPKRARLQDLCKAASLKGTVLLSPEGINLFAAGSRAGIEALLAELRGWPGLGDLQVKLSTTDHQPFRRMLVRLKKEIIAFGVPGIDPARRTSPKLGPQELKRWLDEGRPVTLLDTRNDYEVRLGTFRNAHPIGIRHFRDFPEAVSRLPPQLKEQPVVMFCTGGIRCEKAGPFMEKQGFRSVYQLEGGILKYFEECGGAHYDGECFVFDQRVGLDPALHETGSSQCYCCQTPLSAEDQEHEHYVAGVSCPYCFKSPEELLRTRILARNEQIRRMTHPLPGSMPADHLKPVIVPARLAGRPLLDVLCAILPHVPVESWERRFAEGRILDCTGARAAPQQIVQAGERYGHRTPAAIEPDVNFRLTVLYEDEAIVIIDKPAPLPVHAGGRYFRNTVQHVLDKVYAPQKPRPSHRLDANTTGVMVVARTRHFAGVIQPQFEHGDVEKVYLVGVQGHPEPDVFDCDAPVSVEAERIGARFIDPLNGLPAATTFKVLQRLSDGTALLEARPLTGRTNQIRLHLAHLGFPVCGDPAYGRGGAIGERQTLAVEDPPLRLHAWKISFRHPLDQRFLSFSAPPPSWAAGWDGASLPSLKLPVMK